MRAEIPICAVPIPLLAEFLREVKYQRNREHVELARKLNQRFAPVLLHVRGVDGREPSQGKPLSGNEVENLKRIACDRLLVFVVGNQTATEIRRQDFGRFEMHAGEGRFTGTRRVDEHYE